MSLVKSWSGIYGAEVTMQKTLVYGYYSLAKRHAERHGSTPTARRRLASASTVRSPPNQKDRRDDRRPDADACSATRRSAACSSWSQYSYVERTPFSVPVNTPTSAKLNMVYVNVRYILP